MFALFAHDDIQSPPRLLGGTHIFVFAMPCTVCRVVVAVAQATTVVTESTVTTVNHRFVRTGLPVLINPESHLRCLRSLQSPPLLGIGVRFALEHLDHVGTPVQPRYATRGQRLDAYVVMYTRTIPPRLRRLGRICKHQDNQPIQSFIHSDLAGQAAVGLAFWHEL